jgi:hypothetical protein
LRALSTSGSVIVFCTLKAYFAIAKVQNDLKSSQRSQKAPSAPRTEMDNAKTRLMRIAALVACLTLLNLGVTVQQTAALQTWSENTDQWLTCFRETWSSRDWSAYGFANGHEVCSGEGITWTLNDIECTSACHTASINGVDGTWYAQNSVCGISESQAWMNSETPDNGLLFDEWTFCTW